MARITHQEVLEIFEENIRDAEMLVRAAEALQNERQRRMRREMRERIGQALKYSRNNLESLDCIENEKVFFVFKNPTELGREHFVDTRPLLRQAVVAGCSAFEHFLSRLVYRRAVKLFGRREIPKRLGAISMSVQHWVDLNQNYNRPSFGVHSIIEEFIKEQASTAPSKVGEVLGIIGVKDWTKKIDGERRVKKGTTEAQLEVITARRNQIAHNADRAGGGRAKLTRDQTNTWLHQIQHIAEAIDAVVGREVKGN